jgi:hypothetical protein
MAFWNEPTAPAWYGQQFQLHAPSLSPSLYRPKKTTAELLIEAAGKIGGTLTQQMQKRKQDAIAQSLLEQEASPEDLARYSKAGLQGVAAYSQWNDDKQGQEQDVDKWYQRALQGRKLDMSYDEGAPTESIVSTPYGNMPASKYAALLNRRQPADKVAEDWAKAIVIKRGDIYKPGQKGYVEGQDTFHNDYPSAAEGPYAVLQFPTTVAGGTAKTMVVPYSSYQEKVKTARDNSGGLTAGPVEPNDLPQSVAPTNGKQLDTATAQSILAEAGGDKDKARQLARSRGYTW